MIFSENQSIQEELTSLVLNNDFVKASGRLEGLLQDYIDKGVSDWGIKQKRRIKPKLDTKLIDVPFHTCYVYNKTSVNYLIEQVYKRISEMDNLHINYYDVLLLTTYHETGHIKQLERIDNPDYKKLSYTRVIDRFIGCVYDELTNECSTIKLMKTLGKESLINESNKLQKHIFENELRIMPKQVLWTNFRDYYPYWYPLKMLGGSYKEFYNYTKNKTIDWLSDTLPGDGEAVMTDLFNDLEIVFNDIKLKKFDTIYTIDWDPSLNKELVSVGTKLNNLRSKAYKHMKKNKNKGCQLRVNYDTSPIKLPIA